MLDHNKLNQKYFEIITAIPRVSKNEKACSDYVVSEAKRLGLNYVQDELYDVIVTIPATPGYEEKDAIMLEGHMDLVPAKTIGSSHNFETDSVDLVLDGHILRAKDTTLGADDGVAVAYMLALMNETNYEHPCIECVFTVQEEIGCGGSRFIDISNTKATMLIGLDSTGEHEVTVGNYCSDLTTVSKTYSMIQEKKKAYKLHLGPIEAKFPGAKKADVKDCALQYLASLLLPLSPNIVSISGGKAENFPAIECEAVAIIPEQQVASLGLDYEEVMVEKYLSQEDSINLLEMILAMPNGMLSQDEILLSSHLFGKITTENTTFTMIGSTRCKDSHYNADLEKEMTELCTRYGFKIEYSVRYRSWDYNEHSRLKEVYRQIVKEDLGKDIIETVCPGGLEISDFLYKRKELDTLAIGPLSGGFHTTEEWLDLDSFDRVYAMLKKLIQRV